MNSYVKILHGVKKFTENEIKPNYRHSIVVLLIFRIGFKTFLPSFGSVLKYP